MLPDAGLMLSLASEATDTSERLTAELVSSTYVNELLSTCVLHRDE